MKTCAALLLCLACVGAGAQPQLPIEFDGAGEARWEPLPSYLGNPAARPEVTLGDGAAALRVSEAGRGMKFRLPVARFDSGAVSYLVLRYRAQHLAGGYALYAEDDSRAGLEILGTGELVQDGLWHEVAVDLAARGVTGSIRGLLTEIECGGPPASLEVDYLRTADEAPAGARVVPPAPPADVEQVVKLADLPAPEAHEGWLAAPATRFGTDHEEGALHLWAEGPGRGMKWSIALPEAVDLSRFGYASVRYRARGTAPWGDYLVWLGSAPGGLPDQFLNLLALASAKPDDRWHVAVVPLGKGFKAVDLAVQVGSAGARGDVWIDSLRLTSRRPFFDLADLLPYRPDWNDSRLPEGTFKTVDLSGVANASVTGRLRALALKSWFPAGRVCVRNVPFVHLGGDKDALATPAGLGEAEVAVGARATELYLLMVARMPSMNACRMGDPVPMDAFSTPERFRARVTYTDGKSDEFFPLSCGSGQYEVTRGPEVYCLTGLREVPVKSVALLNRMESGSFLLAGLTLNTGRAVTAAPEVQQLPPAWLRPTRRASVAPGIKAIGDGFAVQSPQLRLDLVLRGGLAVRASGGSVAIEPGPLFELGDGTVLLDSTRATVGEPRLTAAGREKTLTVPVSGAGMSGDLVVSVGNGDGIAMRLNLTNTSGKVLTPVVNFPILRNVRVGKVEDTWYLYTRKGGIISNRPTHQRHAYGGEHPLQVDDFFNPRTGGSLAVSTYDLEDRYRFYDLTKDENGVTYRIEYWSQETQPGEPIATAPTALCAADGDWRSALADYRRWTRTWYKPQVRRKPWFQNVFYYQQSTAWGPLRDQATGQWRIAEFVKSCKDSLGCLDYLHIFDFGESRVYGRVGDYNHYEELGGLAGMREAIKGAQDAGVRMGLYIEGYLCDDRGLWGKDNCARYDVRQRGGDPLLWSGAPHEHMMCPASDGWRNHLAETYRRVAGELRPDGMYIDQYGFTDTWKTCWSRDHGHPVPAAPLRGEGGTLRAIRSALPEGVANLTEETPNDVHALYQDGALGYSVTFNDPALAPHRVDLFRFVFPDFKVLQLTNYNPFTEGGWDLLKWPFFNAEAWWLGGDPGSSYCPDARAFLRRAFAILHRYNEAFTSSDVEPLVPTLRPTVYANAFRGNKVTAWTLFNAEYRTFRGELLEVSHQPGTTYRDAFGGQEIRPRLERGRAVIPVTIGPRDVGCIVAERK